MNKDQLLDTASNPRRIEQLHRVIEHGLARVLRRGFHGVLRIELQVRDGTIQEIQEHTTVKHRKDG
jgi:hypothetical protein